MENKSGIFPCANHILVKPDVIAEKTKGGIIIPESDREKYKQLIAYGQIIALGPDFCIHSVETTEKLIDNQFKLVERRIVKYVQPFAKVGDRIAFAIHSGRQYVGEDGEEYRMMLDTDITAGVTKGVTATSLEARTPVGVNG